jgi:hypothetical protein
VGDTYIHIIIANNGAQATSYLPLILCGKMPPNLPGLAIKFQPTNLFKKFTYACGVCVRQAVKSLHEI